MIKRIRYAALTTCLLLFPALVSADSKAPFKFQMSDSSYVYVESVPSLPGVTGINTPLILRTAFFLGRSAEQNRQECLNLVRVMSSNLTGAIESLATTRGRNRQCMKVSEGIKRGLIQKWDDTY